MENWEHLCNCGVPNCKDIFSKKCDCKDIFSKMEETSGFVTHQMIHYNQNNATTLDYKLDFTGISIQH